MWNLLARPHNAGDLANAVLEFAVGVLLLVVLLTRTCLPKRYAVN